MKRIYLVMVLFFFVAVTSLYAQIYVNEAGGVGIATDSIGSTNKLRIEEDASGTSYTIDIENVGSGSNPHGIRCLMDKTGGQGYGAEFYGGYTGVLGKAHGGGIAGSTSRFGVRGLASDGTTNYGLYGKANGSGTGTVNYGVYGYASGGTTNYAGYFVGNVACTGSITQVSDINYKKNIQNMGGMLEKVQKVKSRSFEYRDDEIKTFPKGKQYGFVAQELEEVFPELVTTEYMPPVIEDDSEESYINASPTPYKSVNYIDMIPILVEAIQEQQAQIEQQQVEIEALRKLVSR